LFSTSPGHFCSPRKILSSLSLSFRRLSPDEEADEALILRRGTLLALSLFYETICSFTGGRQIILIVDNGSELCEGLLPIYRPAAEDELDDQRVHTDKLPLLSGIRSWPVVFRRFENRVRLTDLMPRPEADMDFPWGTGFSIDKPLRRCKHVLRSDYEVSYPAEDVLKHPRAVLIKGDNEGFLLGIPRPSNMKNFSDHAANGAKGSEGRGPC
jgi:hypothetical protein